MLISPPASCIRVSVVCRVGLDVRFTGVFVLPEDILRTCTSTSSRACLPPCGLAKCQSLNSAVHTTQRTQAQICLHPVARNGVLPRRCISREAAAAGQVEDQSHVAVFPHLCWRSGAEPARAAPPAPLGPRGRALDLRQTAPLLECHRLPSPALQAVSTQTLHNRRLMSMVKRCST